VFYFSHSIENPFAQEPPVPYSKPSPQGFLYEVSLHTPLYSQWLKELQGFHRLIQTLFQGELLGQYELVDLVIWPEGLFARVSLKGAFSLSEFLKYLKGRTVPAGEPTSDYWIEEPQWLRLIPQERLEDSDRHFLQILQHRQAEMGTLDPSSPNLFFYYRNQWHAS